ncbi:hypothetical protein DYI37_04925 [Fulvimarina endophytica]|uniref:Uncharacterized protein n=1 Tax=Fulvimarina endophytica TaxID=2293836 RepID=A0A371X7J6_9HYPH|nr:hypothetical protein [Fulvimarina endophytica]RFC65193.1 hypothetical protein DYI37_04925 [Fulvimarina endophytica]
MYLDEKNEWQPPERPERRQMTPREQKVIGWLIGANIVLLFVAPIGGATVIGALIHWWSA